MYVISEKLCPQSNPLLPSTFASDVGQSQNPNSSIPTFIASILSANSLTSNLQMSFHCHTVLNQIYIEVSRKI